MVSASASVARCEPDRVLADLRELHALTATSSGAQRLAWSPGWQQARAWLTAKLAELPCDVEVEVDAAGNLWATLAGAERRFLAIGSHLDSVPDGGWLDGALGVVAALEMLRCNAGRRLPVSLRLVDWADEEGVRFGKSLFGSSAATGRLDRAAASAMGNETETLDDVLRGCGLDPERLGAASGSLEHALGYLELHIEQGPVLERGGRSVAVVDGTAGVERHRVRFQGTAAHAGAAPMDMRHDPLLAASRFLVETAAEATAQRTTATVGAMSVLPGAPTIVPSECAMTLDLRAADPARLTALLVAAHDRAERIGAAAGVGVGWSELWRIAPTPFDAGMVALAEESCRALGHEPFVMSSGALHDAAALAPVVPTAMLFVPSRGGISHSAEEDTDPADVAIGVRVLDELVQRALGWLAARPA
jgi:allantoate deiminase